MHGSFVVLLIQEWKTCEDSFLFSTLIIINGTTTIKLYIYQQILLYMFRVEPCFIPPFNDNQEPIDLPDCVDRHRRHLQNVRILGQHGISHPGLYWKHNRHSDTMECLNYSCRIYQTFDPAKPGHCLSVHRTCFSVLINYLEVSPLLVNNQVNGLWNYIAPLVGLNGTIENRHQKGWLLADPTHLPIPESPLLPCISHAFLTPPPSPIQRTIDEANILAWLPPHILLNIVTYLDDSYTLTNLSHTCTFMHNYLDKRDSVVWQKLCHRRLWFTPNFHYASQYADYYLKAQERLSYYNKCLLQRHRIVKILNKIF